MFLPMVLRKLDKCETDIGETALVVCIENGVVAGKRDGKCETNGFSVVRENHCNDKTFVRSFIPCAMQFVH